MFGTPEPPKANPGDVTFHPMKVEEYRLPPAFGGGFPGNLAVRPVHTDYTCGACGQTTNGRVLCEMLRTNGGPKIMWCVCSCEREQPTVVETTEGKVISQLPIAREYHANPNWPTDLAALYEEAAKSYAAGAFTASAMLCRKLLMECACHEGDKEGRSFTQYVDFIIANVLTMPKAKATIEAIRSIGNEANHKVQFVAEPDAKKAMEIASYMLAAVYSIPAP